MTESLRSCQGALGYVRDPAVLAAVGNKPLVNLFGNVGENPALRIDDEAVGQLAARYLMQRPWRTFVAVTTSKGRSGPMRLAGFRAELAAAGHDCVVIENPRSYDYAEQLEELSESLGKISRPFATFAYNDRVAVHVARALRRLEIYVPEEAAVLGVDNDDLFCDLAPVPISSIRIPHEQLGYEAARRLDALLAGKTPEIVAPLTPLGVVERASSTRHGGTHPLVARALGLIRARLSGELGVESLSRALVVPRRTLEREFRRHAGTSVLEQIQAVRLDEAKRLLLATDATLPDIARRAGFGSVRSLSRVFIEATGVSPGLFRQQPQREALWQPTASTSPP